MVQGFRRTDRRFGARNHLFVLPSVVCSSLAAESIARGQAIAVSHQHGCAEVGDDALHTAEVFTGLGSNPNIAAVLVVSLGCETLEARKLVDRIEALGTPVKFVGIQADGGTAGAIERGREIVARFKSELAQLQREPGDFSDVIIGLDRAEAPFAEALRQRVESTGAKLITIDGADGAEAHADLAAAGCQVIVACCEESEAPRGFAICPVISVGTDTAMYEAMPEDFDLRGDGPPEQVAEEIWQAIPAIFSGAETASEMRDARDFYLRRLARTM